MRIKWHEVSKLTSFGMNKIVIIITTSSFLHSAMCCKKGNSSI